MAIEQLKLVAALLVLIVMLVASTSTAAHADGDYIEEDYVNKLSRHRKNLQGRELRVVTGVFPPVMYFTKNISTGAVTGYFGVLYQLLLFLSHKLNFTYKIFPVTPNTVGVNRNGKWNGIIGTLLAGEADLGLAPVAIDHNRYEAIDFCGRIGGDYTAILVRYPAATVSFTSAFDIFSKEVWIGFFISLVVILGMSKVVRYMEKRLFQSEITGQLTMRSEAFAWYMFSTIVSQGGYFRSTRNAQKFLAATWCLAAFVLVNIYSSTLTAYMSLTFQKPEINSFKDLASSESYQATVAIGSIQEMDFLDSSVRNGDMKLIGDKIRKCLDCRKSDRDEMVETVLKKENYVAFLTASAARSYMQMYNKNETNCRLTTSKEQVSWKPMFLAVPKSFPYQEELNLEVLWFMDSGFKDYWSKWYSKTTELCQLKYNRNGVAIKRSSNRIKLNQFYLPFLILLGGYLLAFIQFCRERLFPPR